MSASFRCGKAFREGKQSMARKIRKKIRYFPRIVFLPSSPPGLPCLASLINPSSSPEMPIFHLLPVQCSPFNCYTNARMHLRFLVVECGNVPVNTMGKYQLPLSQTSLPLSGPLVRKFAFPDCSGTLRNAPENVEWHHGKKRVRLRIMADLPEVETESNSIEMRRRKRIGLANKGRIPWNKGRKHSSETRERIKQRTIEALRDPKVRKKMSEFPHAHSDQSKARIQSSLKRIWEERLKQKKFRERLYLSWAESVAKAAKEGGTDQEELNWDSYYMLKEHMAAHDLRRAADRAKARKMAQERAEAAARAKAEKTAQLAQKRKEQEPVAKPKAVLKRKSVQREVKGEMAVVLRLKLKARLKKKVTLANDQVNSEAGSAARIQSAAHIQSASEKLDLDLIRRQRMRRDVSLADQIVAAKNIRAKLLAEEASLASSKR